MEAGRGGESGRGFLLHWGGAKTKGLFFVLARRCRPLADMSPARVGFNAPSSKNSRLIFAQQPRPNGKRNPLHHVLRTAGTGRAFEGGALLTSLVEQRPVGEEGRVQGSGFRKRGQRSEFRGQGRHRRGGRGGEAGAMGRGRGRGGAGNSHTDGHGRFQVSG